MKFIKGPSVCSEVGQWFSHDAHGLANWKVIDSVKIVTIFTVTGLILYTVKWEIKDVNFLLHFS